VNKAQKRSDHGILPVQIETEACLEEFMRKLAILAGTIALAAISADIWNALAQEEVRPPEARPANPSALAPRYRMFLPDGTPTRPSTTVKVKEANKLNGKKEPEGKGKFDQRKIQTPGLLATPNVTPDSIPPTAEDKNYRVKVRFPFLGPSESEWERVSADEKGKAKQSKQSYDDTALNAAACKMAAATGRPLPSFCRPQPVLIDRSYLDRLEPDRFEQLRTGPGGFNPNKP
jgi:hypothetical protein